MTFLSADVMEYVPDADMIFNYLMISALAAATDYIEREGLKPSGGKLENVENAPSLLIKHSIDMMDSVKKRRAS